jgi:hypothetical protein
VKAGDEKRYPCHAQHDFDFWEGVFTTAPWGAPPGAVAGTITNTKTYEGCVFQEKWDGGVMSQGMSVVIYDTKIHAWRMLFNDDQNNSIEFEGQYQDGAMRFSGWDLDPSGNKVLVRNVLANVSPDVIHHTYSVSSDGGKTWVVQGDNRFTRKR